MIIKRQHDATAIPELSGKRLHKFWAVTSGTKDGYLFFYAEVEGEWYRFFIDHGALFWATSPPDPEDDLGDNEAYADLLELRKLNAPTINNITMKSGTLTFLFDAQSVTLTEVNMSGVTNLA